MVNFFCGSREHAFIVSSDRVTRLPALPQKRASAQLFAQARHAPDQTGKQPQHLYCPNDLTAPTNPPCHTRAIFHPVSWAARPITNREETRAGTRNSPTNEHLI